MAQQITHDRIMQLATGFWASKTFLSAIELRVFGAFEGGPLGLDELRQHRSFPGMSPRTVSPTSCVSSRATSSRMICRRPMF